MEDVQPQISPIRFLCRFCFVDQIVQLLIHFNSELPVLTEFALGYARADATLFSPRDEENN